MGNVARFVSEAAGLVRFTAGMRGFLRDPVTAGQARDAVRRGMGERESAFLECLRRAVFPNPRSPYRRLCEMAGCGLEDIEALVRRDGLEAALGRLQAAGVRVGYEEFKGRAPAVRGSRTFVFRDTDFDNPLVRGHIPGSTGGTRGAPARIKFDLEHITQTAPHWALWFAANGWRDAPLVFWTPLHPGIANAVLRCAKAGFGIARWYGMPGSADGRDGLVRACVHSIVRRATGCPRPEPVPLSEAWRVRDFLLELLGKGLRPCVNTSPSAAVRICIAAREAGERLDGVSFLLRAEPVTGPRKRTIEAAGARAVPVYGSSEAPMIGAQCPNPGPPDDVHVCRDAYAIVPLKRTLDDGHAVNSLLLTSLRPAAPKLLLNAEIGDCAEMETRPCGCLFDELGWTDHLHTIRSFEKLTGEGVTFAGGDLGRVLEEGLPARFGGGPTDYQLVERQDAHGLPRYVLHVSPSVAERNGERIVSEFLEQLRGLRGYYRPMTDLWRQGTGIEVKRQAPLATPRGKVLPFITLRSE
jgi:hypothetical protein